MYILVCLFFIKQLGLFALFSAFVFIRCCPGYLCLLPYLHFFNGDKTSRHQTDSAIYKNKVLGKSRATLLKIFSLTHLQICICPQLGSYNPLDQKILRRLVYEIIWLTPKLRCHFFPSFRTKLFRTKRKLGLFIEIQKDQKKLKQFWLAGFLSLSLVYNESERIYVVAEVLVIILYFTY